MYAIIKVGLPDEKAEILRRYIAYYSGLEVSLRQFFDTQLEQLRASMGPECTVSIEDLGSGDGGTA